MLPESSVTGDAESKCKGRMLSREYLPPWFWGFAWEGEVFLNARFATHLEGGALTGEVVVGGAGLELDSFEGCGRTGGKVEREGDGLGGGGGGVGLRLFGAFSSGVRLLGWAGRLRGGIIGCLDLCCGGTLLPVLDTGWRGASGCLLALESLFLVPV